MCDVLKQRTWKTSCVWIGLLQDHLPHANPRLWRDGPNQASNRARVYQECLHSDSASAFVAEERGKLIGSIAGRIETRPDGQPGVVGYILLAYVREEWRNRGVGSALVEAVLNFFETNGVEDIGLRYVVGNREAERFWHGLGFEPLLCIANAQPAEVRRRLRKRT